MDVAPPALPSFFCHVQEERPNKACEGTSAHVASVVLAKGPGLNTVVLIIDVGQTQAVHEFDHAARRNLILVSR